MKCIALNSYRSNSTIFDSIWDEAKYDAMLIFCWRKVHWTISMYTYKENIDCGKICKKRGGGGHKRAAGFQTLELPFKLGG